MFVRCRQCPVDSYTAVGANVQHHELDDFAKLFFYRGKWPICDRPYQFERKNRPEKMKNPRVAKLSRMGIWPQIHRMPETSWLGQHHVSANK